MKAQIVITIIVGLVVLVALGVSIGHEIDLTANRYTVTATVTDKAVKKYDENDKYLIYTKDNSGNPLVMEIEDNIFAGQFNSSDIYAKIEIGKAYTFDVGGSRVPFLSWYPNIYSATEQTE